jgi:hypothetical protein
MPSAIRPLFLAPFVLFFCGTVLLAVGQKKATSKPDPDEESLEQMKNAGYDLSKPYKLDFDLVIWNECEKEAVAYLQKAGFHVDVSPNGNAGKNLKASKTMVPELSALRTIRRDFDSLVKSPCGALPGYYGWGPDDDQDEVYLAEAKKEGFDLSKPYKLWFRWGISAQCEYHATSRLREAGFDVDAHPMGTVGTILIARKTMVLNLAALQKIRRESNSLGKEGTAGFVSWGFVTDHFDGMVFK